MKLQEAIRSVQPLDRAVMQAAQQRFQNIAIPLGSLGLLEQAIIRLAGIQRQVKPDISRRAVVVFCADNGVVAQGVTQCGQEVTAIVTENLHHRRTTVCLMAEQCQVEVVAVDIGVARDVTGESIIRRKIAYGTQDMTCQPAMEREQAVRALEVGIEMAASCINRGCRLLCAGEMGIGNTTTSAAVTACLLRRTAKEVAGRGAGLSSAGLARKIDAIERALALHHPDPSDPVEVLSKVGGFDIAGIAGLYLGAAALQTPVVIDGVIAAAAALVAVRLCPAVQPYLLAAHRSAEPASRLLLKALDAKPFISAELRLGEGTGAVAAVALLDLALAAYHGMPTFAETEIEAYQPLT